MVRTSRAVRFLALATLLGCVLSVGMSPAMAADEAVTVDVSTVLNTIERTVGVNYVAFWDDIQGSTASMLALRNAEIKVIRFPGGEPGNWYDWADPYAGGWSSTSTMDVWNYAQGVGPECVLYLQTNPTTNELGNGQPNDPSGTHAADWVTYCKNNGIEVPYWDVGNEPDLDLENDYDWEAFQWYLDAFNDQAPAMKARDSSIKVCGHTGGNTWYWWGLHSLDMFMQTCGNKTGTGAVDVVCIHAYECPARSRWTDVIDNAQNWQDRWDYIQSVIQANDTRDLPVFLSETTGACGPYSPGNMAAKMACAIGNADWTCALYKYGVKQVCLFGCIHNVIRNWGILYGDERGGEPPDTPTPSYYIYPILSKLGKDVLAVNGLLDPATTMSGYAGKKPDGTVQVILINKTDTPRSVQVGFSGFDPTGKSVSVYEVKPGAGSPDNTDAYYNGVHMPDPSAPSLPAPYKDTCAGTTYTWTTPAYSVSMLNFQDAGPPVAQDDTYSTDRDTTLDVLAPGVLGNDSDPDGDPITAVLVGDVSHGSLALEADGSFTYTPSAGYTGDDSFTYKANDGDEGDSNVATVSIAVLVPNDPPVANDDSYVTDQDTTLNVSAPGVLGNDEDPDEDPLTAILVADVSHGSLTLNSNGSFTYNPSPGYTGADSFAYKAYDGALDSNVAAVSLSVRVPGATMHVDSITVWWPPGSKSWYQAKADVVIVDQDGAPVSGAAVTGTFSGDLNETQSGTTDETGLASIGSSWHKGKPNVTFCVDNVVEPFHGYDPDANVETCDSTP